VNNTSEAYYNSPYYLLPGGGLWSGVHSQDVLMPQDLSAYLPFSGARAIGLGTDVLQNEIDKPPWRPILPSTIEVCMEFQGIADFERTFKMRPWPRKML